MLVLRRGRNLSWRRVCPEPRILGMVINPRFFLSVTSLLGLSEKLKSIFYE